jgi:hypothetical protein
MGKCVRANMRWNLGQTIPARAGDPTADRYITRCAQEKLEWLKNLSIYDFVDEGAMKKAHSWGFRNAEEMLRDIFHTQGRETDVQIKDSGGRYADMHIRYRNEKDVSGLTLVRDHNSSAPVNIIEPRLMWDVLYLTPRRTTQMQQMPKPVPNWRKTFLMKGP